MTFAQSLLLILVTAFAGGYIAHKLRLSQIVGYVLGGVVISVVMNKYIIQNEILPSIAEMGVALLMFTLGLEFTLRRLKHVGEVVIFGSIIQIIVTIILSIIFLTFFGFDFYNSLFLGSAFSLSSTALVVKILSDKGELDTLPGEISAGWLLIQDIATLPMIVLLPAMARFSISGSSSLSLFIDLSRSVLFSFGAIAFIFILGRMAVPFIVGKVADFRNRELLLIVSVALCLFFAFLSEALGLSFAIGAFLSGVILASSSAQHAIFAEVRPLRDIFSIVFFVSLGFLVRLDFVSSNLFMIMAITAFVIFIKFIASFFIVNFLGYHPKTSTLVGLSLVSVGEFAFILGRLGINLHIISENSYYTIISVAILSLIVSPPLLTHAYSFYNKIKKYRVFDIISPHSISKNENNGMKEFSGHVVILGHGRVGKYIGRALEMASIPYVVVDYNHHTVKSLREKGTDVIYGDPAEIDVLSFARVDLAKVVIVAIPDRYTQEMILTNIFSMSPGTRVICRTHFEEDQKRLKSLGVETVIQPEFEAALSISHKLLDAFGNNRDEIDGKIKRLKIEHGLG
ncbi:MAG: hypothetical protein UT63_C0037G0001 [Candidatus Gottesmanbacteria bacterium GW2011_GWC2_39_8]|uniref:RCK N-terminal domain-containing protein n=1 Tax=Candidatus Gottesmanbacteria bacterium GW2011_GWC2_39_8 TaxID=1618450 RepID=A0A0G0Q5K1_9BACT|nr:MAG: hypothetical protein UT63_C0037G0001 [Candidatus Gottesmanbacteria bacterium GW2011_GWC2_39_8]